jgi:hypothetical protein
MGSIPSFGLGAAVGRASTKGVSVNLSRTTNNVGMPPGGGGGGGGGGGANNSPPPPPPGGGLGRGGPPGGGLGRGGPPGGGLGRGGPPGGGGGAGQARLASQINKAFGSGSAKTVDVASRDRLQQHLTKLGAGGASEKTGD